MIVKEKLFNSHAVGIAAARPYGFKIDFVRNPISGSAARFFVIILKLILTAIYEIKISKKKFLDIKNEKVFMTPTYFPKFHNEWDWFINFESLQEFLR